jgi:homocysteine S-methyltransferase
MSNVKMDNLRYPLLIDGGLSNVLEEMGCDLNHPLWTAKLITENPEAIVQTHLNYILAGADCIATASYQASIPGLIKLGYSDIESKKIILKSVDLAYEAIKLAKENHQLVQVPIVAASIGPYGAYLADGSEYRGNYEIIDCELFQFHKDRIHLLAETEADLLAIETIPSLREAKILSEILQEVNTPSWVSFSCKDGEHLNEGASIEEAISIFTNHPSVFAVGVNCTHPKYISSLIKRIKSCNSGKRIVVYPNSGEVYHVPTKSWLGLSEPLHFTALALDWIKLGTDLIGGCCRIGPRHIHELRSQINDLHSQ